MNPQTAIISDHAKSGVFIEAGIRIGQIDAVKAACRDSVARLQALQAKFPQADLGLVIAFGSKAWRIFGHAGEGSEIKPFTPLGNGLAPATQQDVLIHIQSLQQDAALALAQNVLETFGDSLTIVTEEHGYRLYQERGLDGFVDGTENPQGQAIYEAGIIPEGQADAGGSYVLLQKYRHDLKRWGKVDVPHQESYIGRSKETDEELDKSVRLADSHLGRVDLKENGIGLKIVRRSLPYGKITGEHGLMFLAYCHTLHNIEAQLSSMFGETDGKVDLLLKHITTAVSGAYYFAPSVERLQNL